MTNEEARAYFINCNERIVSVAKDENIYNYKTQQVEDVFMRRTFEANESAIKALAQKPCDNEYIKVPKPCEDCISGKAAIDLLENTNNGWIINKVLQLPPVNPQEPKTGHWIKEKTIHGWDDKSYQCSECGRSIHLDLEVENLNDYPYCHCGVKMIEP